MACWSLIHTLYHHYDAFAKKFKITNHQWWNPMISYINKKTKFLQISDAFHFFNTIALGAFDLAITLPLFLYLGYDWWSIFIIYGAIGLIINLVFNLFYDKIWV